MSDKNNITNDSRQSTEVSGKKRRKALPIILIAGVILIIGVYVATRLFGGARTGIDNNPEKAVEGKSNVLVAYFTWSGNIKKMAGWVSEETGGELFRIVPTEAYGTDFNTTADRAKNEVDNGIRPAISEHIPKEIFDNYDVIYLGFPVWWYDLPMPAWTFLEEYDFSGKTIVPFFSHNGSSNGASSLGRISELAKGAAVLTEDALSIRSASVNGAARQVKDWTAGIQSKITTP